MKYANPLTIALLAVSACSPNEAAKRSNLNICWNGVLNESGHIRINMAEFIYLRGGTIVIPSFICKDLRMQAVQFSSSALQDLKTMERRESAVPLGIRSSILFDVVGQQSRNVIEINVLSLSSYTKLNQDRSSLVMNRVRSR